MDMDMEVKFYINGNSVINRTFLARSEFQADRHPSLLYTTPAHRSCHDEDVTKASERASEMYR